jgi:hypothetical protein
VVSYRYNGLGDRLQETAGGVTTTFTMDLAAGCRRGDPAGEELLLQLHKFVKIYGVVVLGFYQKVEKKALPRQFCMYTLLSLVR